MLVNNIDISVFHATLLTKDIQTAEVIIFDDWLRQSLSPTYLGKQEQFKRIKLEILINDVTDDECLKNIGNLVLQLEKCTLSFNDLTYLYDCTISTKDHVALVEKGYFVLTVELKSGYGYLPEVIVNIVGTSQTITVLGNLPTPAIVILTSTINRASATITGLGKSITIRNFLANIPVIVDGETCLVTQSGINKFVDTDMWDFPSLQAGANPISINTTGVTVQIKYKPKFI